MIRFVHTADIAVNLVYAEITLRWSRSGGAVSSS